MRVHAVSCLAVTLVFCLSAHAQRNNGTAEVFGVVAGAGGASAVLHLRRLDENPVRYYDGYEEIAAQDGSFHFAEIAPGKYRLETVTGGFTIPGQELTVKPREIRRSVVVSVKAGVSLCGHITENGRPKYNTWVTAYRYNPAFANLSRTYFPSTDRDGRFLIPDVTPGTYYLQGATIFYPGSFRFNRARPIVVDATTPTGCPFDIFLEPTGCHTTKVSGHIAPVARSGDGKYRVLFLETNPAGGSYPTLIQVNADKIYKPGDTFTSDVCPGDYDVVLSDDDHPNDLLWGLSEKYPHKVVFDTQHIGVRETPIEGVLLTPRAMASISGEVPGMAQNVACPGGGPRVRVGILREGDGQFQTAELDDKSRFSFHNVDPGEYSIYFGPLLREAFYLDSVLVNGQPAGGRRFTVAQAQPMSIVMNISGDLAHAAGHLSPDERREPRWEVAWTRPKGVVMGSVVGGGKSGVAVKLHAIRYNSNASGEYVVQAAANGSFRFDAVDPGVYTLRAEGKEISTMEYGALESGDRGTPIVVGRNAHIQGLTLAPPKLSSICGKVTGMEGLPLSGRRIFLQGSHGESVRGGPSGSSEVAADTEGRFRFEGVHPGEYFIASPLDVNRIVFLSGDGSLGAALPVRVQAGKDVGCGTDSAVDLHVPPDYRATYSFEGRVNGDLPAIVGDRFWVLLLDVRSSGAQNYVARATLDAQRRFRFDKVPGGRFLLQLQSGYGPEPTWWSGPYGPVTHLLGSQIVQVQGGMAEVTITPIDLPAVTGTVRFDRPPQAFQKKFDLAQQRIALVSLEFRKAPSSAQLSADGAFRIANVDAGDYLVSFNLPGLYIKSVRLNGNEIKERHFHLNAGTPANLEVEMSGDSGRVSGRIVADGSLPMAEPSIHETCGKSVWPGYEVLFFPDPPFGHPTGESQPGSAYSLLPYGLRGSAYGDDSTFRIEVVPPGRYRVVAMQSAGTMGFHFRPGGRDIPELQQRLWNQLATLGEPITVQAGGAVEVALPDRTMDVVRLAAKLGVPLDRGLFDW